MDRKVGVARPFLTYATLSLVAVVVLGIVLGAGYRTDEGARGVDEGRVEAALVATRPSLPSSTDPRCPPG